MVKEGLEDFILVEKVYRVVELPKDELVILTRSISPLLVHKLPKMMSVVNTLDIVIPMLRLGEWVKLKKNNKPKA